MATREALREGPEWVHDHAFFATKLFNTDRAYPLITLGPDIRTAPRLGVLENSRF